LYPELRVLTRTCGAALRHSRSEYLGGLGFTVGGGDPGGVDAQGGGASTAVAEVAGDGTEVDAGRQEFGGGVVAQ
jgi:hypothetical protein